MAQGLPRLSGYQLTLFTQLYHSLPAQERALWLEKYMLWCRESDCDEWRGTPEFMGRMMLATTYVSL
jgi:hypothetical protein